MPCATRTLWAHGSMMLQSKTISALDSWHDAAAYTRFGTPTVSFGPGGFETAHRENERVPVQDLVDNACAVALIAMRFCGV